LRVLLLKTSSLGDLIHCFAALTDAATRIPAIRFDWLVEEAFQQVPLWHPAVERCIPIGLRRWRNGWRKAWRRGDISRFVSQLREQEYDLVLDAQGLLAKSAIPGLLARGRSAGYDWQSAREPLSSLCYRHRYPVSRQAHAIERNRRLFALALDYQQDGLPLDYGLRLPVAPAAPPNNEAPPYLVFLHATTWPSKHWPELNWAGLARLAQQAGYRVIWPWYAPEERLRAERLIKAAGGELAPRLELDGMAQQLSAAAGVVGVDSGLSHLAAALNRPAVTLYGPTQVGLTGAMGQHQANLAVAFACAPCLSRHCRQPAAAHQPTGAPGLWPPCYTSLDPSRVWQCLTEQMAAAPQQSPLA
jgi:heptosyltransferase-1